MRTSAIISIFIVSLLLLRQTVFANDTLTNKSILKSFAQTIRTGSYICSTCNYVHAVSSEHQGLAYEVTCNQNLTYTVVLTPTSDIIIEPTQIEMRRVTVQGS